MKLCFDHWNKNRDEGSEIEINSSNVNDISSYLTRLDQKEFTQISLNGKTNSLMIGGGKNAYVCTFMIGDNEQYFNLINVKDNSNDDVEVVTGGQGGIFEQKIVVDLPLALEAMQYFIINEEMSPQLTWEED
ncbi:hypothetical protein [Pedobacter alluvionis]|uniref:Immunity protein Imm1 of predicted polymorphic toxin system n=1 Tax=Pedobacter alluvionis TaxID=475253 RepID=A0A497Y9G8_9SPHI|nr:hypothetical protein [Pedobacter alluvionis]RLJ79471.1 immunity protein Imm1 of predicted polymorphic toxin system [Pedobacter alluvionis]TFB30819.1 hypothetical protein E3V97_09275 [Pedobacter alluvionis]